MLEYTLIRVASAAKPAAADKSPKKPTTKQMSKAFLSMPLCLFQVFVLQKQLVNSTGYSKAESEPCASGKHGVWSPEPWNGPL